MFIKNPDVNIENSDGKYGWNYKNELKTCLITQKMLCITMLILISRILMENMVKITQNMVNCPKKCSTANFSKSFLNIWLQVPNLAAQPPPSATHKGIFNFEKMVQSC